MSSSHGSRGTSDSPDLKPDRMAICIRDTKSNASLARMSEREVKWISFTVLNYEISQLATTSCPHDISFPLVFLLRCFNVFPGVLNEISS